jgi:hypothetical protein
LFSLIFVPLALDNLIKTNVQIIYTVYSIRNKYCNIFPIGILYIKDINRNLKFVFSEQMPFITGANYMHYSLNGENDTTLYRQ